MPKSISTLQNQITGCERNIQEALAKCVDEVGDKNFQFTFSLKEFVNSLTDVDPVDSLNGVAKVLCVFKECEKILMMEKKRREYMKNLKEIVEARERRETLKRLTMRHDFKKRSKPVKIPTPPDSQELDSQESKELE